MNLPTRLGTGLVAGCGLTVGLGVMMAALIRVDFIPAQKAEAMIVNINPVVEDEIIIKRTERQKEVKKITPPPPPPSIEVQIAAKPIIAVAELDGAIPIFVKPKLERESFDIVVSDTDAKPLLRIAPIMPPSAERSGHCKVRFDVSAQGQPYNVQAVYCTQSLFSRASIKSVQKWKYNPKVSNGRMVARSGVESQITFELSDESGRVIPE